MSRQAKADHARTLPVGSYVPSAESPRMTGVSRIPTPERRRAAVAKLAGRNEG